MQPRRKLLKQVFSPGDRNDTRALERKRLGDRTADSGAGSTHNSRPGLQIEIHVLRLSAGSNMHDRVNVATTVAPLSPAKGTRKAMVWNPQQYLKFSGHRLRPAVDLLMRIPDFPVRSVADLGAGAGNVTKLIKQRWPDAAVAAVEGSAEMVATGTKAAPDVAWQHQDLASWRPQQTYDLVYSNAALHWLPNHAR